MHATGVVQHTVNDIAAAGADATGAAQCKRARLYVNRARIAEVVQVDGGCAGGVDGQHTTAVVDEAVCSAEAAHRRRTADEQVAVVDEAGVVELYDARQGQVIGGVQ